MAERARFWMSNPFGSPETEFEVQADADVLAYLETMPQLLCMRRNFPGQAYCTIGLQYDVTEAYLAIHEALEDFVRSEALLAGFGEGDDG